MTCEKSAISKKVFLVISGVLCLLLLAGAFSNIFSTQTSRVGQKYQLLIFFGSMCNLIGGAAGLISVVLSYIASSNPIIRLSVPLISMVLISDFITIYLNRISHSSSWLGLILTLLILVFIYFSILWKRNASG